MLRTERRLNNFLQSRSLSIMLAALSVIATVVAAGTGAVNAIPGLKGLGLPSANHWITSPATSLNVALAIYIPTAFAMIAINRVFNLLHTLSLICGTFFLWIMGSCPMLMGQLSGGTTLVVVMLAAMTLLFSTFDDPLMTPRVFLAFFLVSAGALTQYGFVAYLPILLMGCGQMRIFNLRTLLAAATGIITPLWIAWGLGVIDFAHLGKPVFESIFTTFPRNLLVWFLSLTGFTVALEISLVTINLIRIYSYNLMTRALNGVLIVTSIATAVLIVVDFTNIPFYFPLLCCCTAFQLGHFAHFHVGNRSCYIVLGGTVLAYAGFYIWRMLL